MIDVAVEFKYAIVTALTTAHASIGVMLHYLQPTIKYAECRGASQSFDRLLTRCTYVLSNPSHSSQYLHDVLTELEKVSLDTLGKITDPPPQWLTQMAEAKLGEITQTSPHDTTLRSASKYKMSET